MDHEKLNEIQKEVWALKGLNEEYEDDAKHIQDMKIILHLTKIRRLTNELIWERSNA